MAIVKEFSTRVAAPPENASGKTAAECARDAEARRKKARMLAKPQAEDRIDAVEHRMLMLLDLAQLICNAERGRVYEMTH